MKTLLFTALFAATALAQAAPAAHEHHAHEHDAYAIHAASAPTADAPAHATEYHAAMMSMHDDMMKGISLQNPDAAFAAGMLPHHQGAVKMAEIQLKHGSDRQMNRLAKDIIRTQTAEIKLMQRWLAQHPSEPAGAAAPAHVAEYHAAMTGMHGDMMKGIQLQNPDAAFAAGMLPHHQGAVKMAEIQLKYGRDNRLRELAQDIIRSQSAEIAFMKRWQEKHSATPPAHH